MLFIIIYTCYVIKMSINITGVKGIQSQESSSKYIYFMWNIQNIGNNLGNINFFCHSIFKAILHFLIWIQKLFKTLF